MGKQGRPKGPKNSQKRPFSTKLNPGLIDRITKRAKKENRSKNNLVETVLEIGV